MIQLNKLLFNTFIYYFYYIYFSIHLKYKLRETIAKHYIGRRGRLIHCFANKYIRTHKASCYTKHDFSRILGGKPLNWIWCWIWKCVYMERVFNAVNVWTFRTTYGIWQTMSTVNQNRACWSVKHKINLKCYVSNRICGFRCVYKIFCSKWWDIPDVRNSIWKWITCGYVNCFMCIVQLNPFIPCLEIEDRVCVIVNTGLNLDPSWISNDSLCHRFILNVLCICYIVHALQKNDVFVF